MVGRRRSERTPVEKASSKTSVTPMGIDELLAARAHPLTADIQRLREAVLGVDSSVREEVKWSSVSFRNANDFFMTVDLRSLATLQVILYTGVKKKPTARTGVPVEDPRGLIVKWAAKDRCVVALGSGKTFQANEAAFVALVKAWIRFV